MNLAMLLVAGVVIVFLGIVAIVVAMVLALRSGSAGKGTTGMEPMWIVVGVTVIALVCCLASGVAAGGAVYLFGVPILPVR